MPPPSRDDGYRVFAQSADTRIDIDAWNAHAVRFFATRVGIAREPRGGSNERGPEDAAMLVVSPDGETAGLRSVIARPAEIDDYALAEAADARAGHTGLALLARRCKTVWLVSREGPSDRLALHLATIVASVLLGPILDASAGELFGIKTARAKLAKSVP
jgi:hypothetical protein